MTARQGMKLILAAIGVVAGVTFVAMAVMVWVAMFAVSPQAAVVPGTVAALSLSLCLWVELAVESI